MQVSRTFKLEILKRRAAGTRQYDIARAAKVDPTVLSAIINNIISVSATDARVQRIAAVLGIAKRDIWESPTGARHKQVSRRVS